MNRRTSDLLAAFLVAVFYALAPSSVPAWRTSPQPPPGVVLAVGNPVRWIGGG